VSPRPRKASDAEILAAAARVMGRVAPSGLTLAEVAAEAGLTPSAVVQRFGSKQGLLAALTRQAAADVPNAFAALRARHRSPLAALRAHARAFAGMGASAAGLAHHLAYLQLDLTDPAMHAAARAQASATRSELARLLADAVALGELTPDADPRRLARLVEVTLPGSLMTWALYEEGSAEAWVRRDLDAVLRPYLPPARAGAALAPRGA